MSLRRFVTFASFVLITIFVPAMAGSESQAPEPQITETLELKNIQSPTGMYFDFSIGPGFLYFNKLRGNLTPIPVQSFQNFSGVNFGQIPKLGYNKTALYEAFMGVRVFYWLKAGLSFYGQSGIYTETATPSALSSNGSVVWCVYQNNLQLYALLFKAYLEFPYPLAVGSWAMNSYLGLGVGPGWQSWTNNQITAISLRNNTYSSTTLNLNNSYSPNAVWTGDAGLSFQPATDQSTMMIRVGCKYIAWGQMKEIGRMKDQSVKVGPLKPIRATNVYSFCPYIGVRWCF